MRTTLQFVVGLFATFLPPRYWAAVNARGIPTFPVLSPLFTLTVVSVTGLPFFYRQLLISGSHAQRVAAIGASKLPVPTEPETIVATAQAISLVGVIGVLFSPAGFALGYLAGSGVLRLLSAYFGEPAGDPLLACLDSLIRRARHAASIVSAAIRMRATYGPLQPDQQVSGEQFGGFEADVLIISSRPKPDWRAGTVILSSNGYYRVLTPVEQNIGGRNRVLYPLKKKHDLEIVRKAIRYSVAEFRHHPYRQP